MAFIAGFGAVSRPQHAAACSRKSVVVADGKGFGGGEATRDPEPTKVDPNDPKGKQKAIHKAESFEDYLKRREREQKK